eukprot:Nitzschia sp. Nitz4//scaffold177_size45885//28662//29183//NITZ4_007207-RA/size45885-processed-gene-0.40-mRNA-1//1//CDS//3329539061//2654//frame0
MKPSCCTRFLAKAMNNPPTKTTLKRKVPETARFASVSRSTVRGDDVGRQETQQRIQLHMNPAVGRRRYSSMEASEYEPDWSVRDFISSLDAPEYRMGTEGSALSRLSSVGSEISDSEIELDLAASDAEELFDPIRELRAINPLIFETNYELEEYGPSFTEENEMELRPLGSGR